MARETNNQREYFRLSYPRRMMPTILIDETEYRISEISERGLRIQVQTLAGFPPGGEVTGIITFKDGARIEISGVTLRWDKREVIVAPLEGVTFRRIVIEQRSLIREFPLLRFN